VFKRKRAKPRLSFLDKLFWVLARRFWAAWKHSLIVVTPETGARWHRAGIRYVLEPDLEAEKAGWQKKDLERGQGLDLSHGSGES